MVSLSLNQNCADLDLGTFFRKFRKFRLLEIKRQKIEEYLSNGGTLREILELKEMYGIKPLGIFGFKDFTLCSERQLKTVELHTFENMMEYCYRIHCDMIMVKPSKIAVSDLNSIPKSKIINKTVDRLKLLIKKAHDQDVVIGFEYTSKEGSSIGTIEDTIEIFKKLHDKENIACVIDAFHLNNSQTDLSKLNQLMERIKLVQLSDMKRRPAGSSEENETLIRTPPTDTGYSYNLGTYLLKKFYKKAFSLEFPHFLGSPARVVDDFLFFW